jgi:hypothetical protein
MKFYVSGKIGSEHYPQMVMQALRDAGHTITLDWTEMPHLKPYAENMKDSELAAIEEKGAIAQADVFILLPHPNGIGMYIEFGIALGLEIPIRIVTEDEFRSMFFCHPSVKIVDSVEDILEEFA